MQLCLRQKIRIWFANSHAFEDVQFEAFCPVVVSYMFDCLHNSFISVSQILKRLIYRFLHFV
jgi:hypothetical protein